MVTTRQSKRIEKFEDLLAWQEARNLTKLAYRAARHNALQKDFSLRDQLQRAAVSVMSNIAEGFERANKQEKLQFLNIARASCGEVRSLLYVCADAGLLDNQTISQLQSSCASTGRLISGLMHSLRQTNSHLPTPNSHSP